MPLHKVPRTESTPLQPTETRHMEVSEASHASDKKRGSLFWVLGSRGGVHSFVCAISHRGPGRVGGPFMLRRTAAAKNFALVRAFSKLFLDVSSSSAVVTVPRQCREGGNRKRTNMELFLQGVLVAQSFTNEVYLMATQQQEIRRICGIQGEPGLRGLSLAMQMPTADNPAALPRRYPALQHPRRTPPPPPRSAKALTFSTSAPHSWASTRVGGR